MEISKKFLFTLAYSSHTCVVQNQAATSHSPSLHRWCMASLTEVSHRFSTGLLNSHLVWVRHHGLQREPMWQHMGAVSLTTVMVVKSQLYS